ncbi:sugar-binding transcriptional regulator [Rhizobium sp. BK251]|uniref:sugar-binding transcriptional regulator n=1 Tax=Rhizobium sp. BK251 TaxID=2512125 RepID=UPI00104F0787|nr:sugar-binding transcriptional regulator [Rhizobium sp. BK251]TCL71331.1 DNA-binding transcriptional regulator LsrR (DeoR family) [Rhizobium sp. BK251]
MSRTNELRLMTRVAQMYHLEGLKQNEISEILRISQASVSRLLRRAEAEGIIRVSVVAPSGTYPDLESAIRTKYGIAEVIVADCREDNDDAVFAAIGVAAAHLLEQTLEDGDVIGVSSWSATLQQMLDNIHPIKRVSSERVIQLLGGIGVPSAQIHATQLTTRLAHLTNGVPQLLPAPCVTGCPESKKILLSDPHVRSTMEQFKRVTTAFVGIGAMAPSQNLIYSGNTFTETELEELSSRGAVGDICLRFYTAEGEPLAGEIYERVVGMTLEELRAVPRVIGTAGGKRKTQAIAGALRGKLVDVLVTDRFTAERLTQLT